MKKGNKATLSNETETQTTTETKLNQPEQPAETPRPQPAQTQGNIVLMDSAISSATHGWSKSESLDARAVVEFALDNVVKAAESKLQIGERFLEFGRKHGTDKLRVLINETSKLKVSGLTDGNIALWMIRADKLPQFIPNANVRRFVLAMTGGEGLVVRDEAYNEVDAHGNKLPKPYILSPYWQQAIEKIKLTDSSDAEVCELNARKLYSHASTLRSKARTEPEDKRIKKQIQAFQKRTIGWLKKHESLVYSEIGKMLTALVKETTDLNLPLAMVGQLDKALNGATEMKEANGKAKVA
jgi:hypothetical protein